MWSELQTKESLIKTSRKQTFNPKKKFSFDLSSIRSTYNFPNKSLCFISVGSAPTLQQDQVERSPQNEILSNATLGI